jgi:hypothetical protein
LRRTAVPQEGIDLGACEHPVIIEIGDDVLHERLRQCDGAVFVPEMIEQDRQGELLRAFALVGPLEAVFGEALDLLMLVKPAAVDRDDKAIDGALALIGFHGSPVPMRRAAP